MPYLTKQTYNQFAQGLGKVHENVHEILEMI
jgi:hypothetical protein